MKRTHRLGFTLINARSAWLLAACLGLLPARAQPLPKISSLSPEWVQRGATAAITIKGENLAGVTRLVFSGDTGLAATLVPSEKSPVDLESSQGGITTGEFKNDKQLKVSVTIGAGAMLGAREVRVVSPAGVSNPLRLNVDYLPEIAEVGTNHSIGRAQKIELPAAIEGTIGAGDETNCFRFTAKKDQQLIFDVYAFRTGSPLDSSLAILDAAGKELAHNEDYHGFDSFIDFRVPADGDYLVQLRDFQFRGGADYKYRLVAGATPYVDSVFPLGGQRGHTVEVELQGRDVDGVTRLPLKIAADSPLGRQDIRVRFARGFSNPVRFDVSDLPEIMENEPNNETNQANAVSIPVVVNGRINGEKDVDVFRFKVGKDTRLICAVEASGLGSPLDSLLTLTDAKGTVLQQNDDADGPDAKIDATFTKGTEYFLTLRDLLNRGGDRYTYRLSIQAPRPDFLVRCLPDTPRLSRGGHVPIRCELSPEAGFSGTVRVACESLPPGVFSEPLVLSPATPSGLLILSAADDARLGSFPIRFAASSVVDGSAVTRMAKPLSDNRPAKEAFLTVLDHAPFTIDPITLSAAVEQEQTATIEAEVQRWNGFAGEIKISVEGYSAGREPITRSFDFQPVTLKGSETRATLKLKAKVESETGMRNLLLRGEAKVDGLDVAEYSRPLPMAINQLPFTLASNLKRLSVALLPPGAKSAAGEAVFTVKADRRGFTGEIALSLDGLPDGIAATLDRIPADAAEATIKLTAKEKAPVGKEFPFTVVGVATFNDRNYRQRTAPITWAVTPPPEGGEEKTAAK
ncbi:MAG: PPC domain-containing protein [Limisphaerales bacterium]